MEGCLLVWQLIVSGLIFGCIYGLAALGLVLIYRTTDVVNFAQGEMAMVTTFVAYVFLEKQGFSYGVSFLLALLFAAVFGMVVQFLFMRPVQQAPVLNQIVLTLGLYMVFHGLAGIIWGYTPTSFPEAVPGSPYQLAGIYVTPNELFVVAVTLALMLLFFAVFRYTKIGLAMRATSQDTMTSELMGIQVSSVFTWTWVVGTVLGGVAGMLTAPTTMLDPNFMADVLIMAFAAAVLGGFISLPGAILGGLIIGVVGNLITFYVSAELKTAFIFLLIILILYVRPTGLFGARVINKV
ncbi:MAG: branched-chain amino acid ABC transporter permease [Bacillus thermozeamaize]|uniref:Branched-chain amino acid ABC transporter permease n=1 Tax=Bacillus thermozeamaize TaxID=230954 RepID=A0A1Y3PBA0_9BACI|nr:MAG: branched-chain amino acid ABC transporter permease [Bacillus thermozeamaize]